MRDHTHGLRERVETHRELTIKSSVYEDVTVDVEELAALLDVVEAANEIVSPDYRTAPESYAQGVRLDAMRDLMDALDRLANTTADSGYVRERTKEA